MVPCASVAEEVFGAGGIFERCGYCMRYPFGVGVAEQVPPRFDEFAPAGVGHEDDGPFFGVVGFLLVAAAVGDDRRAVLRERHEVEVAYGVDDAEAVQAVFEAELGDALAGARVEREEDLKAALRVRTIEAVEDGGEGVRVVGVEVAVDGGDNVGVFFETEAGSRLLRSEAVTHFEVEVVHDVAGNRDAVDYTFAREVAGGEV